MLGTGDGRMHQGNTEKKHNSFTWKAVYETFTIAETVHLRKVNV